MRGGHAKVARAYILYREEHRRAREEREAAEGNADTTAGRGAQVWSVVAPDGSSSLLDTVRLRTHHRRGHRGPVRRQRRRRLRRHHVQPLRRHQHQGARPGADHGRPRAGRDRAQLLLRRLPAARRHAANRGADATWPASTARPAPTTWPRSTRRTSRSYVARGIELGQLDPVLAEFDLERLGAAIDAARDGQFTFLGLQTLYDRYFLHHRETRYELPQAFFMRVAMGLAIREARPRGAGDRVLPADLELRLHVLHADAVQRRHHPAAAVQLLPDHRRRRPGRHLPVDQEQRPAGQVLRRPRQRLDPGPRHRRPHQGHQRPVLRRRAVPQDRQRHRGRGEPGRQAQGRGLRLPRDLAHRRRGVPRPAQEHR